MARKVITTFLPAALLFALVSCAPGQPVKEAENKIPATQEVENETTKELSGEKVFAKSSEEHILKNILARHKNVEEHITYFDGKGNEETTVYRYADDEIYVREDSNSNLYIQNQHNYYFHDAANMERGKIDVVFGMENVFEDDWEKFMNETFEYVASENDEVIEVSKTEGYIFLTVACDATLNKEYYELYFPEEITNAIVPGTKDICQMKIDAETYMIYEGKSYLQKPDGTEMPVSQSRFSYDVEQYKLSEELLEIINGTDRTLTVIADPATEQEKTYVQSCGENGTLRIALQEGYQKLYADEACTQETTTFDENGERTVYTVKEP